MRIALPAGSTGTSARTPSTPPSQSGSGAVSGDGSGIAVPSLGHALEVELQGLARVRQRQLGRRPGGDATREIREQDTEARAGRGGLDQGGIVPGHGVTS